MTYIGHDSQEYITVNGYQDPGSYVRMIRYATHSMEAMENIIERADSCRQYIEYRCNNSKLLAPVGESRAPLIIIINDDDSNGYLECLSWSGLKCLDIL